MPAELSRVETIFNDALAVAAPDERRAFLDRACTDDADLRQRVEDLLADHDAADDVLRLPYSDRTLEALPVVSEGPGTTIGRYKLLEQIGEGGFGVVFMAEQQQPVRRRVALKVIRLGMDTRQVIARFEAERQALAMMDHPNIARVFDAGATETGRPYFVMELVRGIPITDYCDQHKLSTKERLGLFMNVCSAVQHAHQKGIIHRDIKPTNVLVTLHESAAVPKVIDFGIAKATGQHLTEKTLFTNFAQMIGTPLYMSPEQADMTSVDIDTRSDVYSLGVLLYELLTGTTPLDKERLKRSAFDEIRRIIREEEPPRPSTRLSTTEELASISAQRHTEPAKLTKLVRGELDWIVMKALEKDRSRRYETANGFAMDVQRYLADEPVAACPPSAGYMLRKFARKNRKALFTAGAFLVLLGSAAVVSTWQAIRATQAEAAAIANAEQAQLNAEEAQRNARQARDEANAKAVALQAEQKARADETKARQQAFAALRSMSGDVIENKFTQGAALTEEDRAFLRGVIAQFDAFAAIKGDDADSRAVRAEGRYRVGGMRHTLGELKEAEQDFDQALSLCKQLAADFPSRPGFRFVLANVHNSRGILLRDLGRLPEAEKDFDQALSLRARLAAEFPTDAKYRDVLAASRVNRGIALAEQGRLAEAKKEFDEALSLRKRLAAEFPSEPAFREALANVHNSRGSLLSNVRPKEVAHEYDQALRLRKQLAADFPSRPEYRQHLATSYRNRGNLLRSSLRPTEAEKDFDHALSLCRGLAADFPSRPEYRQELAETLSHRANLLWTIPRLKEAEQDQREALSLQKQLAADHPSLAGNGVDLAFSHKLLGSILRDLDRLPEAEKEFDEALSLYKRMAAELSSEPYVRDGMAGACLNLALLRKHEGNWGAAKQLLLDGRPHHLAALKAIPGHELYRRDYRTHLELLIDVNARLLEHEDAVRTAETYRDLGWNPPADAYDAACVLARCIPMVAKHGQLDDGRRQEAVRFHGDEAMKLLRTAVDRGYRDAAHVLKDADLDPLRQRADFEKLVTDLGPAASDRARSYLRLSQWDKAAAAYAKALELKPDDYQVRNQLAWIYATCPDPQFRRPPEAVALAERAVAAAAQDANCWNTLGVARYRAGDWPGAVTALQKYRELRTNDAEWSNPFFLAMAHWQLGNKDEARRWYDKGVEWMDRLTSTSETLSRFRAEAAELLRVNEKR
jgi:eukaryotic-like serine/threonine-protein kinase